MKKMIQIPAVIFLLAFFHNVQAGSTDTSVKKNHAATVASRKDSSFTSRKICSCQVINVQTKKFNKEIIGIFAEKTLEGKIAGNYRLMDEFIRREKTYFKIVFESSAELEETIRSETDCLSLYNKLREKNALIRMYNILNIDVLSALVKR